MIEPQKQISPSQSPPHAGTFSHNMVNSGSLRHGFSLSQSFKKIASSASSRALHANLSDKPVLITESTDPADHHNLYKLQTYYCNMPDIMNPIHLIHNAMRVQLALFHDLVNVFLWAAKPLPHLSPDAPLQIRLTAIDVAEFQRWWAQFEPFMSMCSAIENRIWMPEIFKHPTDQFIQLKDEMVGAQQYAMQLLMKLDFKFKMLHQHWDESKALDQMQIIHELHRDYIKSLSHYFTKMESIMPELISQNIPASKTAEWEDHIFKIIRAEGENDPALFRTGLVLFFQGMPDKDAAKHCAHAHLTTEERLALNTLWKHEVNKKYHGPAKALLHIE